VLADGFYEWQRAATGGAKQPFHITVADRDLFAFAGLWSVWHGPDGSAVRSCTILTTAASPTVAPLHDRMPVILPRDAEPLWLAPDASEAQLRGLFGGTPDGQIRLRPVAQAVNDARYDGPECLADPVQVQATLF
jgi:putative SOS response-associated peptidase YedK